MQSETKMDCKFISIYLSTFNFVENNELIAVIECPNFYYENTQLNRSGTVFVYLTPFFRKQNGFKTLWQNITSFIFAVI